MPIRPYLAGRTFEPEIITAMGAALEGAGAASEADYARQSVICQTGAQLPNGNVDSVVWEDCIITGTVHTRAEATRWDDHPCSRTDHSTAWKRRSPTASLGSSLRGVKTVTPLFKRPGPTLDDAQLKRINDARAHLWTVCMRQAGVFR